MDLSKYANSMHVWAMIFLLFLAATASFALQKFPLNLIVSILVAIVLDLSIKKFYLKKELSFPFSAFISGTIIGSVAPLSSPTMVVAVADFVAIISKHFIKLKGAHIFNPAALGLLLSLAVFGLGDEWWAATSFSFAGAIIILTPLLIFPNWKAMKLRVALPFLTTTAILSLASGDLGGYSLAAMTNAFYALPYYFGFIMVSEPRTSPYQPKEQMAFGILIATLLVAMKLFSIPYYHLASLLVGNLAFSIYRGRRIT